HTDTESLRLLAAAPPAFALMYCALRRLPVLVSELIALDVEDVDLRNHGVRIRARRARLPVGAARWGIFLSALRSRQSRPACLAAAGRRWNARALAKAFRRLADHAGLPSGVCLAGRGRVWRLRRGLSPHK